MEHIEQWTEIDVADGRYDAVFNICGASGGAAAGACRQLTPHVVDWVWSRQLCLAGLGCRCAPIECMALLLHHHMSRKSHGDGMHMGDTWPYVRLASSKSNTDVTVVVC